MADFILGQRVKLLENEAEALGPVHHGSGRQAVPEHGSQPCDDTLFFWPTSDEHDDGLREVEEEQGGGHPWLN